MKKFTFNLKRTSWIGYALAFIQTLLLLFTFLFLLSGKYENQWRDYLNNQTQYSLYLNNIPTDKKDDVISYLKDEAEERHFLLLKKEQLDNSYILGIAGDLSHINDNFSFENHQLISNKTLNKLLHSSNEQATLGLGKGSINQLASIYKFPLSDQIVIYKLDQFTKITKSINGQYQLVGLSSHKDYQIILSNLEKITSLQKNNFTNPSSGGSQDNNLLSSFLLLGILVTSVGLFAFFFINLLSSLKEFGTLVLLGWSKSALLFNRYKPYLIFTSFSAVMLSLFLALTFGTNFYFSTFIFTFIKASLVNLLLLTLIFYLSPLLVVFLKNISLIKGQYPKKILYSFIIGLYLLISALVTGIALYIDGPSKEITANAEQAFQWQKVEKMAVIKKVVPGDDGLHAFSDSSSAIYQDILNFYKSIAKQKGVYYISSFYASSSWLSNRDLYKEMPTQPFTILSTSPNYLTKINFSISKQAVQQATAGQRIFYIPDTYPRSQQKRLKVFLKDFLTQDISKSDVKTTFSKQQTVKLITYHPSKNIFLWNNNSTEPTHSTTPIIDVVTPKNMTFIDIGNLLTLGLNGGLKFSNSTIAKKILKNSSLSKYHLDDNHPESTTVSNYIDGEQKSLWQTIVMFGIVLVFLIIILCLLIITLAISYKTINAEKISVKKLLGFTFWQIYRFPFLVIIVVSAIELVLTIIARSKIGIPLIIFTLLIQTLVFYLYLAHTQFKQIINLFKGE